MDAMQKKIISQVEERMIQCIKKDLGGSRKKRSHRRSSNEEEEEEEDDDEEEEEEEKSGDDDDDEEDDDGEKEQTGKKKRSRKGSTTVTVVARDNQDSATWPEIPAWAMSVSLNPNPRTIADIAREWNMGFNHGITISALEKKYKSKWRQKKTAMGQNISRMKIIMEALETQGGNKDKAIVRMQNELYNYFEATTEEEKNRCHVKKCIWSGEKNYVDQVLRPRRVGYKARQTALVERAGKRQKKVAV